MATKKRIPRASKHRLMIFGTMSIIIVGYFFVTLVTYSINIKKLKQEQAGLQNELISLKENAEELSVTIEKLKDPDYIARYARENYLYSKDGEYIIKIEKSKKENIVEDDKPNYYPYYIWGSVIGMTSIFIYILRRK